MTILCDYSSLIQNLCSKLIVNCVDKWMSFILLKIRMFENFKTGCGQNCGDMFSINSAVLFFLWLLEKIIVIFLFAVF